MEREGKREEGEGGGFGSLCSWRWNAKGNLRLLSMNPVDPQNRLTG